MAAIAKPKNKYFDVKFGVCFFYVKSTKKNLKIIKIEP